MKKEVAKKRPLEEDKPKNAAVTTNGDTDKIVLDLSNFKQNWKQIESPFKKRKAEIENKIWFDVDNIFLPEADVIKKEPEQIKHVVAATASANKSNIVETKTAKLTKAIAMDCEMVGVGDEGRDSILARISIVNQLNQCIYDKYVLPTEHVTDYRTHVSGIRAEDLRAENGAVDFKTVQIEVAEIIKDRKLIGHAIHNDLNVLYLSHSKKDIRDTQKCKIFRKLYPALGSIPSLKALANVVLGIKIQEGEHNSVVDAQCAMRIYTMFRKEWEMEISSKYTNKSKNSGNIKKNPEILLNYTNPIDVKQGNTKHKKFVVNKIKRRNKFLNKK